MSDLCVRSVSAWCTSTRNLINNMDDGEIGYSDGSWTVMANDPVHWGAFVLEVLKLLILLPKS
jgi:hypothetical protein